MFKDLSLVSFAVSWVTTKVTSPASTRPLTLTDVDPVIKIGDAIYIVTDRGLKEVGTIEVNDRATITFSTDPDIALTAVPAFRRL